MSTDLKEAQHTIHPLSIGRREYVTDPDTAHG